MKNNICKYIFIFLVLISLCFLTSCGDDSIPCRYNVSFKTNNSNIIIEDVMVLEGYHITGTSVDLNDVRSLVDDDVIFDGWYSDSDFNNVWDVDTYRVCEDMTLYAKWIYPQDVPSEVTTTSDAFSKTITWIQKDLASDTVVNVKLVKGNVVEKQAIDPNTKETVTYESVTYNEANIYEVTGELIVDGYYAYYTLDDQQAGGIYKLYLETTTKNGTFNSLVEEIRFKGVGTIDDPYLIYNEADLKYITTKSFNKDTYAELKADITIHSIYAEKQGCTYDGMFSGNNHIITLKNNSGLFYELGENAEVHNVKFSGSISGSEPSMGVVANYSSGYIHHCESISVSVSSTGGKANDFSTLSLGGAGGIVGTNKKNGRITLCTITSGQANVISGNIGVGGIAGINYGKIYEFNSTVTPCSAIIGAYNGKEISVTVANSYAGVAVGVNFGEVSKVNVDGKINCRRIDLDESDDIGASNVGGVVGYNATGALIEECLFHGMRCVGDTNVGGIAGYNDGTIINCFTGRRLRKPSGTSLEERMFISPVIGNYNVGGICGKCGENSVITNVFSTANVWSYGMKGYSVSEKASNAISINKNQNPRLTSNYLGQTYGEVYSNDLVAPVGENNIVIDNSNRVNSVVNNLLGAQYVNGTNVQDNALTIEYLRLLGDKFGYNSTYGISLLWQSGNTHAIGYYTGEEEE